jgi:thiamine-monophosphate kinase
MLRRGGARSGDLVAVSGTIGDGMLGLEVSLGRLQGLAPDDADWLRNRYLRPQPRLALGARLRGWATAGADVSDGLIADLGNIARASGLGAQLDLSRIPLSSQAVAALALRPELVSLIPSGGDDYELVVALAPSERARLQAEADPPLTIIGKMVSGKAGSVTDENGQPLGHGGYRHFGG